MAYEVYKTTDYSKFKVLKGNRNIYSSNLLNIKESISKNNLLEENPIKVNQKYEVIDGQHRLEAAKILKVPIYYVIINDLNLSDVQTLNTAQRAWILKDFLISYIKLGNNNYVRIREFMEKYSLQVRQCLLLLTGSCERKSILDFKNGLIKISELDYIKGIEKMKKIQDIRKYLPILSPKLINSLLIMNNHPRFRLDTFNRHCEVLRDNVSYKENIRDYLRMFEDIYNFRLPQSSQLNFKAK